MGGDRPQTGLTAGDPAGSARPRLSTGARARDMAVDAGAWVMSGFEWWLLRSSQIPTTAFLDRGDFPWATTLEEHWRDIRADLDTVLARHQDLPNFQDILRDVAPISQDDRWKTFFFTTYGYRVEANLAACPRMACLLKAIPGLVTAFFSILSPHKHIPPHRGPYRGVVRCHLGLKIPSPPQTCGIKVGGEVAHWREGQTMFFDDGYEHSAWNDSDETRVVLFLDVIRPLRQPAASVNTALLRAISARRSCATPSGGTKPGNGGSSGWPGSFATAGWAGGAAGWPPQPAPTAKRPL